MWVWPKVKAPGRSQSGQQVSFFGTWVQVMLRWYHSYIIQNILLVLMIFIFLLYCWRDTSRWEDEIRPQDYLTADFEERMAEDGIQYKLQIQLHEIQPDDSHLILHTARAWDHATHPWLDLADVRLTSLLPFDVIESTRCSLENIPESLSFPPAKTIYDYNSIGHMWSKIMLGSSKQCSTIRRPSKTSEDLSIYCITVFTGDRKHAGTNANVTLTITGKIGIVILLTEYGPCCSNGG